MTIRIMSLAALSLAFSAVGAQQPAQSRPELVRQIDSIANDYLATGPTASAAVAVVRGNDTIVMRGYGYANMAAKRRAGPTTVYEIGSITKQFTSSAIMRLVEQGKINLDDDVSKYVPGFPLHGRHVAIRQLLNHTSGIHNYTAKHEWQPHWAEDLTTDSIVGFVKQDTLDFAPGTKWSYSNTGYVLLGMVVEKASGKPYATYLHEQFFKPLGLRQTRYCPSHAPDTTFATGYSIKDGQLVPSAYLSMTHPFSAGALCSTVRDFLVWQRALNNSGRVVSAHSYALMTTPDTLANGTRLTYGFGLGVSQIGSHRMISHGGGINGFTTAQLWVPDDTLSVIMFTNTDSRSPDGAAVNIARAVLGLPFVQPPRAPPAVPLDPALRDQVVGTYAFKVPDGSTLTIHVYAEGERLMSKADLPGQDAFPLVYYGNNTFGAGFDPSMRLAFVIESGHASRATLTQGGATMEGTRKP